MYLCLLYERGETSEGEEDEVWDPLARPNSTSLRPSKQVEPQERGKQTQKETEQSKKNSRIICACENNHEQAYDKIPQRSRPVLNAHQKPKRCAFIPCNDRIWIVKQELWPCYSVISSSPSSSATEDSAATRAFGRGVACFLACFLGVGGKEPL